LLNYQVAGIEIPVVTMSLQKRIFMIGRPSGEGVLYQGPWIFGHPETVQSFQHTFLFVTFAKVGLF
jgi:hypothetical protein